jgi:hypothetical protein
MNKVVNTPAGHFEHVVQITDTTPLEPKLKEFKLYTPGVGLVDDNDLKLVKYGYLK